MKKETRHCESCVEFEVDVVAIEVGCQVGFRPRFYQPQYGTEVAMKPVNDWGFKRRCNRYIEMQNEDIEEKKKALIEIGYREYR